MIDVGIAVVSNAVMIDVVATSSVTIAVAVSVTIAVTSSVVTMIVVILVAVMIDVGIAVVSSVVMTDVAATSAVTIVVAVSAMIAERMLPIRATRPRMSTCRRTETNRRFLQVSAPMNLIATLRARWPHSPALTATSSRVTS